MHTDTSNACSEIQSVYNVTVTMVGVMIRYDPDIPILTSQRGWKGKSPRATTSDSLPQQIWIPRLVMYVADS